MKIPVLFILLGILLFGCESKDAPNDYPAQFGEIPFEPSTDDTSFKLCDSTQLVHSRTSLSYVGGRIKIEEAIRASFGRHEDVFDYNGYVLVRFLVNCKGEVGRLRFEALDDGFMKQEYPEGLLTLIRESVQGLSEWTVVTPSNMGKDHSKYLNVKIINGQVDAIIH